MSTSSDPIADNSAAWQAVIADCGTIPFPGADFFAIPLDLIDLLNETVPGLWTTDELRFEYSLASHSGGGFQFGRPLSGYLLSHEFLSETLSAEGEAFQERHAASGKIIEALLAKEYEAAGRRRDDFVSNEKTIRDARTSDDEWRIAFGGWLIMNAEFVRDVKELKQSSAIHGELHLPQVPVSFFGRPTFAVDRPIPEVETEFQRQWCVFRQKWCLESLLNYEVPIPLRAAISTPLHYDAYALNGTGLMLFLPWHALQRREIDLRSMLEPQLASMARSHLGEWFEKGGKGKLGKKRLIELFRLFVFRELALRQRYESRFAGRIDLLDEPFARYFETSADSIKKLRLDLQRRRRGVE